MNSTRMTNLKHYEGKSWIATGLSWGIGMYLVMILIYPTITGEEIILKNLLIGLPIYAIGGLLFGLTMRKILKIMK